MTAIIRYNGVFSAPADTPTGPLPTVTSDSFNRANSDDLIGSVSDGALGGLGIPWEGYPAKALALRNGKLVKGTAGSTFSVGVKIPTPDVDVTFLITEALTSSTGLYLDIRRENVFVGQSPDSYRLQFGATTFGLTKRLGGVTTSFVTGIPYKSGDVLRYTIRGSEATIRVNGAVVHQFVDSSIPGAGYVAFSGTGSAAGFEIDYVAVNRS